MKRITYVQPLWASGNSFHINVFGENETSQTLLFLDLETFYSFLTIFYCSDKSLLLVKNNFDSLFFPPSVYYTCMCVVGVLSRVNKECLSQLISAFIIELEFLLGYLVLCMLCLCLPFVGNIGGCHTCSTLHGFWGSELWS